MFSETKWQSDRYCSIFMVDQNSHTYVPLCLFGTVDSSCAFHVTFSNFLNLLAKEYRSSPQYKERLTFFLSDGTAYETVGHEHILINT